MAEPKPTSARLLVSIAAVTATLGGALALAVRDAPTAAETPTHDMTTLDVPTLAPLPTLPTLAPARAAPARPTPVARTRSSR